MYINSLMPRELCNFANYVTEMSSRKMDKAKDLAEQIIEKEKIFKL